MTYYNYPSRHMVDRAKTLRCQQTSPEELLWTALRNGQVGGLKFRHMAFASRIKELDAEDWMTDGQPV